MIFFLFCAIKFQTETETQITTFFEKAVLVSGFELDDVRFSDTNKGKIPELPKDFKNTISFDFHEKLGERLANNHYYQIDFNLETDDGSIHQKNKNFKAAAKLLGMSIRDNSFVTFWEITHIRDKEGKVDIDIFQRATYVLLEFDQVNERFTYIHSFN